jgi:hypothetical protein
MTSAAAGGSVHARAEYRVATYCWRLRASQALIWDFAPEVLHRYVATAYHSRKRRALHSKATYTGWTKTP